MHNANRLSTKTARRFIVPRSLGPFNHHLPMFAHRLPALTHTRRTRMGFLFLFHNYYYASESRIFQFGIFQKKTVPVGVAVAVVAMAATAPQRPTLTTHTLTLAQTGILRFIVFSYLFLFLLLYSSTQNSNWNVVDLLELGTSGTQKHLINNYQHLFCVCETMHNVCICVFVHQVHQPQPQLLSSSKRRQENRKSHIDAVVAAVNLLAVVCCSAAAINV